MWYSILWQPKDFSNKNAFIELDGCPRFWFSENKLLDFRNQLETEYPNLLIVEIFQTSIFVKNTKGVDMPTHYRHGIFMPNQNIAYDNWLQKQFDVSEKIIETIRLRQELIQKNMFLEYSSKIIRHDMHSGINTYMPRGMTTLLQRLTPELIKEHKLGSAITLLERGLKHTQTVYQGVYAFTNLVKEDSQIDKVSFDLKLALIDYLLLTAYHDRVIIDDLITLTANKSLICTAIDNLIRNGLKYNEHKNNEKYVKIYMESPQTLVIEDNGVGMGAESFERLARPYQRGDHQKTLGTGLGLNICVAIVKEHGYIIECEKIDTGTKIRIKL